MQLASWSKVTMYSQGVFDVWFACPFCKYESWARAYGVGEGMDTGIQKSASASAAQFQANVMAEHAAQRAVHGSPCPRCGQHHPDIVRWASVADRAEKQRIQSRKLAGTLRLAGLIGGGVSVLCALLRLIDEAVVLGFCAAVTLVASRVLGTTGEPMHNRWFVYKRTAPGVTFLTPP